MIAAVAGSFPSSNTTTASTSARHRRLRVPGPGRGRGAGSTIAVDSCGWQFVLERDGDALIERRTLDGGIVSYGEDAIGNLYAVYRGQGEAFRVTLTETAP